MRIDTQLIYIYVIIIKCNYKCCKMWDLYKKIFYDSKKVDTKGWNKWGILYFMS